MYQLRLNNAIEELKDQLGLSDSATLIDIAKSAHIDDFIGTDMMQFMPELAAAGFFDHYGQGITFTDIMMIITDNNNYIIDRECRSIGIYKTFIWWLRALKKSGKIFINNNNAMQDGSHPFDIIAKTGDIYLLAITARYCLIEDETYIKDRLSKTHHPRFGNPAHNLLAYWVSLGHPLSSWFLKRGYSATDKNSRGVSLLMMAARTNSKINVLKLLGAGADFKEIDPLTGQTPLHAWAYNGTDLDILKMLISEETLNLRDLHGQTPLFYAMNNVKTWSGYFRPEQEQRISYVFSKMLIDNGADINVMNKNGHTIKNVFESSPTQYEALGQLIGVILPKLTPETVEPIEDKIDIKTYKLRSAEEYAAYMDSFINRLEDLGNDQGKQKLMKLLNNCKITMHTPSNDVKDWVRNVFTPSVPLVLNNFEAMWQQPEDGDIRPCFKWELYKRNDNDIYLADVIYLGLDVSISYIKLVVSTNPEIMTFASTPEGLEEAFDIMITIAKSKNMPLVKDQLDTDNDSQILHGE